MPAALNDESRRLPICRASTTSAPSSEGAKGLSLSPISSCPAQDGFVAPAPSASPALLCHQLLNTEQHHATARQAASAYLHQVHANARAALATWRERIDTLAPVALAEALALEANEPTASSARTALSTSQARHVLTRFAPQGLVAGAVLQSVARPVNAHQPLVCAAHRMHASLVGDGRYERSTSIRLRRALERAGVDLPAIRSPRLLQAFAWRDEDWGLPAYELSLACVPLGNEAPTYAAALMQVHAGVPTVVAEALRVLGDPVIDEIERERAALRSQARNLVAEALADNGTREFANKVVLGFLASKQALASWKASVIGDLEDGTPSATQAMIELVARKGRHATGYHGRLKLSGEAFDDLVTGDPTRFVAALAHSPWICPGHSESSPLLGRLIEFGGPMFRVFNDEELAIVRAWIDSLGAEAGAQHTMPLAVATTATTSDATPTIPTSHAPRSKLHVRDRYLRLLNVERHPEARLEARDFADEWLARHALAAKGEHAPPFETYSHDRLCNFFDARSRSQASSYGGLSAGVDRSREDLIDEALQIAPMILIDGAWLQRWGDAGLVDSPIGALLFKILTDEIGNGRPDWNHPNIYRRLLNQMALNLAPFDTREFAWDPRIDDESFEVPVFWLSVSQYPTLYLPETLGLNLAMELSGVGGSYRTARDELRVHGFETLFVDLHNTIDNVSSGHSAMALEAIQIHLDDVAACGSQAQVDAQWRRVWIGYLALSRPPRRWRDSLRRLRYAP